MSTPTLPEQDPFPIIRSKQLESRRSERAYDYTRPDGIACLKDLPASEKPGASYIARIADSDKRVSRHASKRRVEAYAEDDHEPFEVAGFAALNFADSVKAFWDAAVHAAATNPKRPASSMEELAALTDGLEDVPLLDRLRAAPERWNELFARQRLAGPNPLQLEQLRERRLPDHFPFTEDHFARAYAALTTKGAGADSLARAIAEGRLFVSDCKVLDGVATTSNEGRQKYQAAPIGLFVRPLDGSAPLLPLGIQCAQRPSAEAPMFTPADGWRWRIAQAFLSLAEGSIHEAGEHLGLTHLVMEAYALASARCLAPAHPVTALLTPHFKGTHFINATARNSLIGDFGTLDQIMPQPIEATRGLCARFVSTFRIDQADPATRLRARGLLDADALPEAPYREDALPHWDAMLAWVTDYLRLYYVDDAAVAGDVEVQSFVRELGARDGARLAGVPEVRTVDALARLLCVATFTGSVQHAAVNFPQYPFMGWVACIPAALYAPPPTLATPDTEASLLAAMPPLDCAALQMYSVFQLSAIRDDALAKYPPFDDARVEGPLAAYRARLDALESAIAAREATRALPYPYLLPSLVPASIII